MLHAIILAPKVGPNVVALTAPTPGKAQELIGVAANAPGKAVFRLPLKGTVPGHTLQAMVYDDDKEESLVFLSLSKTGGVGQLYRWSEKAPTLKKLGGILLLKGNRSPRAAMTLTMQKDELRVVTGTGKSYVVDPKGRIVKAAPDVKTMTLRALAPDEPGGKGEDGDSLPTYYGFDLKTGVLGTLELDGAPKMKPLSRTGLKLTDDGFGLAPTSDGKGAYLVANLKGTPAARTELWYLDFGGAKPHPVGALPAPVLAIAVGPEEGGED